MSTQPLCTMSETMQNAMKSTWMSGKIPSTFRAALRQSSPPPSAKELRCLQEMPMIKENRILLRVCSALVQDYFVADIISRRRERCAAPNAQNTTVPRCFIKARTCYSSSPSGNYWQAIGCVYTSDAIYPKQCTNSIQLCAQAVHKKRKPWSSSRS